MSIEFKGMEECIDTIESLVDNSKIERALIKCCLMVERSAKQKAPKGNGQLRNSISHKVENLVGSVYTPLEYAPYVEYGTGLFAENGGRTDVPWCYQDEKGEWHTTSGMKPSPYMRPALDENLEEIKRILWEAIKE